MRPDLHTVRALAVELHGRRIGVINRLAGDQHIFAFEEDYIEDPERPALSLSFKGSGGELVSSIRRQSARLPPFFSNLLPEGHLRRYLAERAGVKQQREFFLLAALGADLPGAVVVSPHDHTSEPERAPKGHDGDVEAEPDSALRFSLAGVQLKFSAIQEANGGLTIPVDGMGGSWIVKLPDMRFAAVPENEFAMLELARAIGIDVPATKLLPIEEIQGLPEDATSLKGNALAIERFDRGPANQRVHMEDFAQVFGAFPDDKYEGHSYANIAAVLRAEIGDEGTGEFVRRLVFTVLIGNGDMHLKNWSLLYPDQRTPILAPAYDFVSTVPYMAKDKLGLSFGKSRSLSGITKDQVRRFTDTARLPVSPIWELTGETTARTLDAWRSLDAKDVLPSDIRGLINQQIENAAAGVDN
ncbi:MAG: HipA domain-containing protein [Myxococcota bacterium]